MKSAIYIAGYVCGLFDAIRDELREMKFLYRPEFWLPFLLGIIAVVITQNIISS